MGADAEKWGLIGGLEKREIVIAAYDVCNRQSTQSSDPLMTQTVACNTSRRPRGKSTDFH